MFDTDQSADRFEKIFSLFSYFLRGANLFLKWNNIFFISNHIHFLQFKNSIDVEKGWGKKEWPRAVGVPSFHENIYRQAIPCHQNLKI